MARAHGQPAASASPKRRGARAKSETSSDGEDAEEGSEAAPKTAWGPMTVRKEVSIVRTSRSGRCQLAARVRRPPSQRVRREAWRIWPPRTTVAASTSVRMLTPGPRPRWAIRAAVISAREQAASEVAAWRRRSWQLVGLDSAALRSSCSCGQLATRSFSGPRSEYGGAGGSAAPPGGGPPAAGGGEGLPPPTADGSSSQDEKLGARPPRPVGSGRSNCWISLIQASLAPRVRLSPAHCWGSRMPVMRKPGQEP